MRKGKKLGCFAATGRLNTGGWDGFIEGAVTELKSGKRYISFIKNEVVLWIGRAEDIILEPGDVANVELLDKGNVFVRSDRQSSTYKHTYGRRFRFTFKDGSQAVAELGVVSYMEESLIVDAKAGNRNLELSEIPDGMLAICDGYVDAEQEHPHIIGFRDMAPSYFKGGKVLEALGFGDCSAFFDKSNPFNRCIFVKK